MNKPTNFKEMVDAYRRSPAWDVLSERTKQTYTPMIAKLIATGGGFKLFYTPSTDEYQEIANQWFNQLSWNGDKKCSNNQRNYLRMVLSTVYKWGIKSLGIMSYSDPTIYMPTLKVEKKDSSPFDRDEIEVVRQSQAVQGYHKLTEKQNWVAWIVRFLFETGMRPAEMINLRVTDVVSDEALGSSPSKNRYLQIIGSKGREAGKVSRYLYVTNEVAKCLEFFKQHRMSRKKLFCDRLIVTMQGKKVNHFNLGVYFKDFMTKVGIGEKILYDLRRGCASEIIHNPDYGVTVAQKQLGHKNLATTMIYENIGKKRAALLYKGH